MTRPLAVVPSDDPRIVAEALRDALSGSGPAVLPRDSAHRRPADAWDEPLPERVTVDTALVVETSGSTGRPKRVVLSANALLASVASIDAALGGPGQWLLALPAHYIAGAQVLIRSLAAGTRPVIMPSGHFDPVEFVRAAEEMDHVLRFASLVPAQLARLIELGEADATARRVLTRFDALLIGGQSMPGTLRERADALGLIIRRTYGSSETSGGCIWNGIPLASVRVRETEGEIEIAGPMLATGYLGDDELTAEKFYDDDGDRWYRTSDGGTVEDGVVRVHGRLDNVIISGGVKISLDRVERAIHLVPGYEDAVVVGAPSERWGQEPVVVLTWTPTEEQFGALRAQVAAEIGRIAAPRRVVTIDPLPLLPAGKPDRRAITRAVSAGH